MLTFGSLFAGIGGFDLGFERAGMRCEWQVEIDDYATRVLEKHWPNVRRWRDVRTFPPEGEWDVDVICGGFPCQDISSAGKRSGIDGERSGLWSEFVRIIRLLRPQLVVIENVADLAIRGLDRVLCDLASLGFDAEWTTLYASDFGAPHSRGRTFIVAHPVCERRPQLLIGEPGAFASEAPWGEWQSCPSDTRCGVLQAVEESSTESALLRSGHGVSARVDRITGLGNAVVPQIAEWIGRQIVEASS